MSFWKPLTVVFAARPLRQRRAGGSLGHTTARRALPWRTERCRRVRARRTGMIHAAGAGPSSRSPVAWAHLPGAGDPPQVLSARGGQQHGGTCGQHRGPRPEASTSPHLLCPPGPWIYLLPRQTRKHASGAKRGGREAGPRLLLDRRLLMK